MSTLHDDLAKSHAKGISRIRKERHLLKMSEDDFRDQVVVPIFERSGLKFLADTCGPAEKGTDCLFTGVDHLGHDCVYAIQTKRGNINLSSKPKENLLQALTQLKTALGTKVSVLESRAKVPPNRVILCASGRINQAAKDHIVSDLSDARIDFLDVDELINKLDDLYPEFWLGLDQNLFPYLRAIRSKLLAATDTVSIPTPDGQPYLPVADEQHVPVYVSRIVEKITHRKHRVAREPVMEQIPFQGLLRRKERVVLILGEGGSGKTTALRRLAFELADTGLRADGRSAIPIVLKSSSIAVTESDLVNAATKVSAELTGTDRPCFSNDNLDKGDVVVLIDGLDEVDVVRKDVVISLVRTFHARYPRCLIVVASRDTFTSEQDVVAGGFTAYRVVSLQLKQAIQIVQRLCAASRLSYEQAGEMLRRLQDVHGIRLNPLLVTVFVANADFSKKDIPPNITELFKKFTEMMLGRWDEKKGLAQQYLAPLKDFVLCQLAFDMHARHARTMQRGACEDYVRHVIASRGYTAQADELLGELLYRSGLLRIEGNDIGFRHHLLQEFFAGRAIDEPGFIASKLPDEWWRNAIVFYFGENAARGRELCELIKAAESLDGADLYTAAVAIGLAVQACYLAHVSDKDSNLHWVIGALARTYPVFRDKVLVNSKSPFMSFIHYYLSAREAVASDRITVVAREVLHDAARNEDECLKHFWALTGLVEIGELEQVKKLLATFRPQDQRLLLALHMGCFFVANLRISSEAQKRAAKGICDVIGPGISPLIDDVVREIKTVLLEKRQGSITPVLDQPELDAGTRERAGDTAPTR
jgi:hypothetical protein